MTAKIFPKKIKGIDYYYYQYTYREKIYSDDEKKGKGPGSGKSRVKTHSEYLGSAKFIRDKIKNSQSKIVEVKHYEFGLIAAAYSVSKKIGLVDILNKHIEGVRFDIPRATFFLITIINRIDNTTSKEKMGDWAQKSIIPQLLSVNSKSLNSKTYWYVTDDIISEKKLREKRRIASEINTDLFAGLDNKTFQNIEKEILKNIQSLFDLDLNTIVYDTTNFYTYIQQKTPSILAQTGHNKDSHHHLRQIGLALAVEKKNGIPLFHRVYRGNGHDSKTFLPMIQEVINESHENKIQKDKLILVIDKGNNSIENFDYLVGKVYWVGSLVPSNHTDLLEIPLTEFKNITKEYSYYKCTKQIMGRKCRCVVTYNKKLYRKQKYSLENGIKKIQNSIIDKIQTYKNPLNNRIPKGIKSLKEQSRYGKYFEIKITNDKLYFSKKTIEIEKKEKRIGKNILFSNKTNANPEWMIDIYKEKNIVEDDFKVLKDHELIKNRPIRHWTDTKICTLAFSCVTALSVLRVMQLIAKNKGLEMSPNVLKQELKDLKLITWIDENLKLHSKVSAKSTIQKKLYELFELEEIEKMLTIHLKSHI